MVPSASRASIAASTRSRAAILDRANHPLPRQLDAELLGNFLAEFDLKPGTGPVLLANGSALGLAQSVSAPRSMTVTSERESADARATMLDCSEARVGRECSTRAEGRPTPDGAMHQFAVAVSAMSL
jgi:hypothetical protein